MKRHRIAGYRYGKKGRVPAEDHVSKALFSLMGQPLPPQDLSTCWIHPSLPLVHPGSSGCSHQGLSSGEFPGLCIRYSLVWLMSLHFFFFFESEVNLDSILKSRDITLPTKVHLVKAMIFPGVMYGCEIWTIKKAECRRMDAFELWCWRRLLSVP